PGATRVLNVGQHRIVDDLQTARFHAKIVANQALWKNNGRTYRNRAGRLNSVNQTGPEYFSAICNRGGHYCPLHWGDTPFALSGANVGGIAIIPSRTDGLQIWKNARAFLPCLQADLFPKVKARPERNDTFDSSREAVADKIRVA